MLGPWVERLAQSTARWPRSTALRPARRAAKAAVEHLVRLGLPRVTPRVLRVLPHDERAFTQGLAYHDGSLYESTGGYGRSDLRRIDPGDGRILGLVAVPGDFAEGIAVLRGRIYQLSWHSGKVRLYRVPDLAQAGEMRCEGEGWGLAAIPQGFVMSDGTSILRLLDEHFRDSGSLRIRSRGVPIWNINDIECVGPRLYANILGSADLLEVSLEDGRITRVIDCSPLASAASPGTPGSVLNGIAHDRERGTLYLTGKNWNSIFEVSLAAGPGPVPEGGPCR